MRSLTLDIAAIVSMRSSCHVRRDSPNNTAHAGDAFGDRNVIASSSGIGRDGARMQDGGQDAVVGELDGYAFHGHIECGVAAAIRVKSTGAVIIDRTEPCDDEDRQLHFARGNVFDETLSDIDWRNGIDPHDLGKLVHVRQNQRARSVRREGCRVVDKEVYRGAA